MDFSHRRWRLTAILLLAGLFATILVMYFMAEIHEEIGEPFLMHLDRSILDAVHREDTSALTRLMFALTEIGSPRILIPVIPLLAGLFWWRGLRDEAMVLAIAMGGGAALDTALKLHFRRVRPDVPWAFVHEHSFSFPSGHSVLAVILYGTLAYLGLRRFPALATRLAILAAALLLIGGIGFSRIYLGVHYPSDVAAGYLVGSIWLLTVIASDWYVRRSRPPASA